MEHYGMPSRDTGAALPARPRPQAGALAFAGSEAAMEAAPVPAPDQSVATANAGSEAASPAARKAVLSRLEQLANDEIGAARALVDAKQMADVLAACIDWDLDSSTG
ncbi:hypothetical protein MNQ95_14440 [Pseudoxanthomonas daejeonensis]|uniref:hypothetical protein n=1 Tax=Pseudoxanthomonas daejeonensis TaxID=266062 RepID=UPI001F548382|nr:hypothetical protein [Pseudoxanthomonas daejeonensis]UNK57312.1 hypothetical protein MNQ95_14440 [Pseudoxanthomonas daejeonensis]